MTQITVTVLVATTPRYLITADGLPICSFRAADSIMRFDRVENKWVNGETNWYTITSLRTLATHVSQSINKGDRIIVTGTVRVRDWDNGERAGTSVEIEATSVGHDLAWGESTFTRKVLVRELEPQPEYEY